jgi:HK97 family phage portal protein
VSIAARAAKTITWTFDTTVQPEHDIIRERLLLDNSPVVNGSTVSVDRALGHVPIMAAVRLMSETIGSLPLPVYERIGKGKDTAFDHRLYELLHDQANPEMSAMVFRETVQGHTHGWGTGYAEIEYDTDGFPLHLWPLQSGSMSVFRDDGELVFLYRTPDGKESRLTPRQVFRLPAFGSNGITGYAPIHWARRAIALGMASEEFAGRFYDNDARPGVAITVPIEIEMDDDAKKRLAESFDATHAGLKNKHRTAVLDEGMGVETFGFSAEDAQLIEQQRWSVEQVARIFNIPLHLLHSLERATFNNIEEMGLNFVTYSLRPWLVRWEQQIKMQLLVGDRRHFAEFNVDGLLRGRLEDRMKAYWQMFQMGSISPDEIRAKENMNPRPDGAGDVYYTPVNMAAAGETDTDEEAVPVLPPLRLATRSTKTAEDRRKIADRYRPLFERVTRELVEFESEQVLSEAERRVVA